MCDLFAIDDLFLAGIALDLTGAWLLAKGLLASPELIVQRGRYGAILVDLPVNTPQVISEAQDRVAARTGIVFLAAGFVLQAVGYGLGLGGLGSEGGLPEVITGLVIAAGVGTAALTIAHRLERRLLKGVLIQIARSAELYWRKHKIPSAGTAFLAQAAEHLSYGTKLPDEGTDAYIQRAFGVRPRFHARAGHYLLSDTPDEATYR